MEISQAVCVANVPPARSRDSIPVRFRGSMREDFTWENSLPEEREFRVPSFNQLMRVERSSRLGFAKRWANVLPLRGSFSTLVSWIAPPSRLHGCRCGAGQG